MENKKLYIIGSGGFGREVAWLVERINEKHFTWDIQGFIDDDKNKTGALEGGYPVLGGCEFLQNLHEEAWIVCAIGSAKVRKKIIDKIGQNEKIRYATLIDPSANMSSRVQVGEGSIVCAGNIFTVDITIGKHALVNLSCTIGHDAVLGDFVTIYPGVNVSGCVTIEDCVEIGTGTKIIQGKTIGKNTIIGAGAVVNKDMPRDCVAVGIPAKPIKYINERE